MSFFFLNSRLRQFCHWLLKFLQKSQPSKKKNQSKTTDVRFIKTFLSFNIKTPVLVKTCRCPYSNVHSVACWIKKKYIPLSQNSQTRRKQRLPIVVPTTPLICFRVMCAPICKMIKWRKFETVFILIFITDFFILLIYIVSWIAWKYLTKALFIHVCIVLFSRGKRWLVRLNHRGKKWRKMPRKHGMHLYRRVNLASPFLMNLKDHVNCFCSSVSLCFSSWLCSRDILKDILKYNKDTEVGWATRKQ